MRILVSGNLGYVGSVATRYLAAKGHDVAGLDTGFFTDCTAVPAEPIEQSTLDVRNVTASDLPDVDAVVHLAALSNDPLGELNASITEDINVGGSLQLARAARERGIPRFVFASSCSMYGVAGDGAVREDSPQSPQTAYARSKVEAESGILALAGENFTPISLRFATAYGFSPRPRLDVVVNNLVACALLRGTIELESDGTPWRPLVHVEDMSRAIDGAVRTGTAPGAYNVGSDVENYQVREIAAIVAEATGNTPLRVGAASGGDTRSYRVSFERFASGFADFVPRRTLREAIGEIVASYRGGLRAGDFESDRYFRLRRIRKLLSSGMIDASLQWTTKAF